MPLVRIDFAGSRSPADRRAIADGVHLSLVETMTVPADDRFQVLSASETIYDAHYLGIDRSQEWVMVQVFLRAGRTPEAKQAFYRRVVERLAENPGVRPEDVMITLTENGSEDWSFGRGEAPYIKPKTLELGVTAAVAWVIASFGATLAGVVMVLLAGGVSLSSKEALLTSLQEIVAAAPRGR